MAEKRIWLVELLIGAGSPRIKSEDRRSARLLATLILIHAFLALVSLLAISQLYGAIDGRSIWEGADTWIVVASAAIMLLSYGLIRAGRYRGGAILYVAVAALVPLTVPFLPGPTSEMGVLATAAIPILLAAMVLEVPWMIACSAGIAVAAAARLALCSLPPARVATGWAILASMVLAAALVLVIRVHFAARERDRLGRVRESEALLRTLMDNMAAGVMIVDEKTHLVDTVNKATAELCGAAVADIEGRLCHRFLCPAEQGSCPITDMHQEVDRSERMLLRADGTSIPIIKSVRRISIQGRDKLVETFIDITERKRAEEEKARLEGQLQQAQKMDSVGRLAGGVAHDFNNMLGVILGHVDMALEQAAPAHPLHDSLVEIRKAARRSADLTRQLLAFARKQTVTPKVLDLNETVAGMITMLQRLIGEHIRLDWQPAAGLWSVNVDPSQVDQVLTNLCVNARDSIASVGTIAIETGNSTVDAGFCTDHPGCAPGDYVRLCVRDDGCGMNMDTLAHIYEPFFTTKGIGKGTGLGLATVYGIVKQANGFISAESATGKGTAFTIFLPRCRGKAAEAAGSSGSAPGARGQATILMVEDEPAILEMARAMLGTQGYTVLAAGTPREAIRLAREHAGEIRLLVTDVVMPEMNGRDLAEALAGFLPRLKHLFMSGYTADVIAHHGVLDKGMHFIQKPFSRESLAAKVREVLGGE
jgi:two-component system, cell cycle sensor histidine kinase and response regulator CckA